MKKFLTFISLIVLLSSCSSKKYFEPEESYSIDLEKEDLPSDIKSYNKDGATLKNNQALSSLGVSDYYLPEGYEFLNEVDGKILASNKNSELLIDGRVIKLDGNVVAASIKDNILAVIYSTNTLVLYNLDEEKYLLKEYLTEALINDVRIANPIFFNNLILFPTLDGKIVIANNEFKIVKNIVVDASGEVKNIIYLKVIKDTLITATNNKLLSISPNKLNIKDLEIRNVISTKDSIYISTIDGTLYKFDANLNELGKKKFRYAKFYALAFKDSLYALESQGFLISIDDNFEKNSVYDFSFDKEEKVISIEDKIYFEDKYITLP